VRPSFLAAPDSRWTGPRSGLRVEELSSRLGVREGPPRGLVDNEVGVEEVVQALVRPCGGVDPDTREELAQP